MPAHRARRGDRGIYEPAPHEPVRITGVKGIKFSFVRFDADSGGDFAIVQGPHGQRYLTVDRIRPVSRRRSVV